MDYISLKKKVIEEGLLDRQYGYYAFKILSSLATVVVFGLIFLTVSNFWIQLLLIVGITVAVLQFCRENSLPYVETGVFRSYRIILGELRKIAKSRPSSATVSATA